MTAINLPAQPWGRTYAKLWLCCLDPEQHERTCGYWYTVTCDGFTPHTAFRTKDALLAWLQRRGLRLPNDLPAERGEHQVQQIEGSYIERQHSDISTMPTQGARILKLSNAEYTAAVVTHEGGVAVVNFVNVNSPRPAFDYEVSRKHEDAGLPGVPGAMLMERNWGLQIAALPA